MSTADLQPTKVANLRRSQRVCLSVPIVVLKGASGASQASEETRTLIVSAHGALLVMRLAVQAGDLITIKHNKTQEELVCRVVNVGPDQSGKREIGVEFEHPSPRFWRIAFPPADWSPRNVEAKAPTKYSPIPRPPVKKAPAAPAENQSAAANNPPGPSAGHNS
ncbi:MAG: PilZ domain-containing protein [Candidatus Acidiferrum sp.]